MKKKLLAYYEHHLAVIKKSKKGFRWNKQYCYKYNIQKGFCYCAYVLHDKLIFEKKWIQRGLTDLSYDFHYWVITPQYCRSTKELIECFEYRINKLKTVI